MMEYVDSHAHFDLCIQEGPETEELLADRLTQHRIRRCVHVAIDTDGYAWGREFSRDQRHRGVLFTLGIHPSSRADTADLIYLSDFANDVLDSPDADLLFGIGEAGLDYFRMRKPKEMQVRSFEYQAELAKTLGLPLVVHSRDAMPDTLEILRRTAPPLGVMHCFSGDREIAMSVLDLGFHISFAGNLTYRSAVDLQESARYVPLDRLLLETDAPFLAPVPHRGKRCRPEHVVHTYEFCADLKKEPLARFADQLNRNFDALLSASRRLRK